MNMINIILLVVLITYQTVMAVIDRYELKKFKGVEITEKMRLHFYKETIIWGWVPVWIILFFSLFSSISLENIGLRKITLSDSMWLNSIVLIIAGLTIILLLYQIVMYFISEAFRTKAKMNIEKGRSSENHYDSVVLNLFIPRTFKEKKYFFFVSLTAGICEEVVLRGGVMFLLADLFPGLHIVVIGLIASVLFGLFHCYQGVAGIIKTGVIGMFLAMLYIVTDSLIPGILLHFLMDFSSAFILKEE